MEDNELRIARCADAAIAEAVMAAGVWRDKTRRYDTPKLLRMLRALWRVKNA